MKEGKLLIACELFLQTWRKDDNLRARPDYSVCPGADLIAASAKLVRLGRIAHGHPAPSAPNKPLDDAKSVSQNGPARLYKFQFSCFNPARSGVVVSTLVADLKIAVA